MGFSCSDVILPLALSHLSSGVSSSKTERERGYLLFPIPILPSRQLTRSIWIESSERTTPHSRLGSIYVSGHLSIGTLV